LEDWSSILRAGDIFSMDDVPIDIGPTRHDLPTINWTVDQLTKGIFYHARELNDAFTSVFT
jgi:catechol 2,3-dioxygenase